MISSQKILQEHRFLQKKISDNFRKKYNKIFSSIFFSSQNPLQIYKENLSWLSVNNIHLSCLKNFYNEILYYFLHHQHFSSFQFSYQFKSNIFRLSHRKLSIKKVESQGSYQETQLLSEFF